MNVRLGLLLGIRVVFYQVVVYDENLKFPGQLRLKVSLYPPAARSHRVKYTQSVRVECFTNVVTMKSASFHHNSQLPPGSVPRKCINVASYKLQLRFVQCYNEKKYQQIFISIEVREFQNERKEFFPHSCADKLSLKRTE